jgi:phytoene dehydrogenase-like protein
MKHYDVIIIGGGISGLAVAALLSKKGYHIALLEKEPILGGRCTSFYYRGYTVDIGLHAIASYSSSGIRKLVEEVGAQLELVPIRPSLMHYDLDTKRYIRATSPDRFGEATFRNFKKLVGEVADMDPGEIARYHSVSAESWILDRFKDRGLLEFFKKITGFSGQPMDKVSAGAFLETLNDAFTSEATICYPAQKGIKALPDALEQAIKQWGGEIVTGINVRKILFHGSEVKGIKAKIVRPSLIADAEFFAPMVVFSVPLVELPTFLPGKKVGKELQDKIDRIKAEQYYYNGMVAGVKKSLFDGFQEQYFQWTTDRTGMDWHAIVTVPTYVDPELAPGGYHLLFADSHGPMPFGDAKLAKQRLDELMEMLKEIWPNFEDNIDWVHPVIYPTILPLAQISLTGLNRPGFVVPDVKGLYLAGDATYLTGSGIGSAVKSAYGCVEKIEKDK